MSSSRDAHEAPREDAPDGATLLDPVDAVAPEEWSRISGEARQSAERLMRGARWRFDADDLAQEGLLRLLKALRRGLRLESSYAAAWVHVAMARILQEVRRRSSRRVVVVSLDKALRDGLEPVAGPWSDPVEAAIASEAWEQALGRFARLPRPCCEIATLKYSRRATDAQVISWLQTWRSVGDHEARRQIRRTEVMLLIMKEGGEGALGPARGKPARNPWISRTPPPFPAM